MLFSVFGDPVGQFHEIGSLIPDDWLHWTEGDETACDLRDVYRRFLTNRLNNSEIFVKEAQNARKALI